MNRLHFKFCKHLLIKSNVHFKNFFNNALHVFFDSFTWTFQNILFLKYGVHKILCEGIFFTYKHYKHWIIRRFTCSRDSKQVPHFNTTHQYFPSLNFEFVSCFIIGSLIHRNLYNSNQSTRSWPKLLTADWFTCEHRCMRIITFKAIYYFPFFFCLSLQCEDCIFTYYFSI